jgi:hypothetical protein
MSGISKEERLKRVHARAYSRINKAQATLGGERLQCLQDRRFASVTGAQWEGKLGEQFANKPRFEMNKVHLAVIRIFNEYRANRITVDFTSKDGSQNDRLADACDGLFRADEQDSGAQEAYDNMFDEGVSGGFGACRLTTCYEDDADEDDTRQRIKIIPVTDADACVFFDLDAKRQDKADAQWGVVLTGMSRDAYTEKYDDNPATWDKQIHQSEFDWATPEAVYVAEYYEIEQQTQTVHVFQGMALGEGEPNELRFTDEELDAEGKRAELQATGFRAVRSKRITVQRVHKYILSGNKVLEDGGLIAGCHIPIVPFYGKRWFVDGVERCMGHVRLAKDAQQLANMLRSWLAEMAARFDVEKPIFTPEQMLGHTGMWSADNIERYPYLLVNPMTDANGQKLPAGPIGYTKAPLIPPAMAGLMQISEQDLQDLLGNQQAGEQIQANVSAKAVELVQNKLDMQTYIYMDNFAKAVKRIGEVWLGMAKDVYVEDGRKMKSVSHDGAVGSIELYRPTVDESGAHVLENDLGKAKFDVNVEVGPSSSSKRAATVRALTGMMQVTQDPETLAVLSSMSMLNMEGEGLADVRDFFRNKMVRMGVVKPTDEEKAALAQEQTNAAPDPNAQFLQASAAKALADAKKADADALLTEAKVGQTNADTIATLAGVEQGREQHAVDLATQLGAHGLEQRQAALAEQQAAQQMAQPPAATP